MLHQQGCHEQPGQNRESDPPLPPERNPRGRCPASPIVPVEAAQHGNLPALMLAVPDLEQAIVLGTRHPVGKAAIGLLNLLQAAWKIPAMIGMMAPAQPDEGIAYHAVRRISRHAEHLVIIGPRHTNRGATRHSHPAITCDSDAGIPAYRCRFSRIAVGLRGGHGNTRRSEATSRYHTPIARLRAVGAVVATGASSDTGTGCAERGQENREAAGQRRVSDPFGALCGRIGQGGLDGCSDQDRGHRHE
nr:hypothetical protein [Sphingomonas sp. PAMC 26605]